MRSYLTWPALTTTDIARALLIGAAAGTVSGALRWVAYRYERDRRLAKLTKLADETTSGVAAALEQARTGFEQMIRGGNVTPPDLSGSVRMRADGSFDVPGSDLGQIIEDLNRVQKDTGSL